MGNNYQPAKNENVLTLYEKKVEYKNQTTMLDTKDQCEEWWKTIFIERSWLFGVSVAFDDDEIN